MIYISHFYIIKLLLNGNSLLKLQIIKMMIKYKDREDAGRILAKELKAAAESRGISLDQDNTIILAIPDEGIIPGYIISKELNLKMNLLVVGKLKVTGTDTGFGSISIDGTTVFNDAMINRYRLTRKKINIIEKSVLDKMINRIETYDIAQINLNILKDKIVIIVDEGAQTGYSMMAAIKSINLIVPRVIVVGLPTASFQSIMIINRYSKHICCSKIIDSFFFHIKDAYEHYHKLDEKTVLEYIDKIKKENLLLI